ncbi:MAG TPA: GatB/YqeY domain-containing protein [Patescibacteria group bacterium]|nr:GatB/YqeY domain-containing protein [Patescibacteria group bacterium]
MIKGTINNQIADALRAKDELRLTTLRMLSSSLNYEFIAKQHELSEEEELAVVRREVKKRRDTVEEYKKLIEKDPANVQSKIDKEEAELKILLEYLPTEMGEDELRKIVDEVISETGASEMRDMGRVIGLVLEKTKGAADGRKISELAKEKLLK